MVSAVTEEGLGHEGGQKGDMSVGLTHLHLPQLHLDGLDTNTDTHMHKIKHNTENIIYGP